MEGPRDSHPAPVSERGDDQSGQGTQVLVAVVQDCIDLLGVEVLLMPIVLELHLPHEVSGHSDVRLEEVPDDVSIMHVLGDHSDEGLPLVGRERGPDQLDDLVQLHDLEGVPFLEVGVVLGVQVVLLGDPRPVQGVDGDDHLARELEDPLVPLCVLVLVLEISHAHDSRDRVPHGVLEALHPLLYFASWRAVLELDDLVFRGDHGDGDLVVAVLELELGDVLEGLEEVGLHLEHGLGGGQDVQQLVVRQEEEPLKVLSLLLKVLVQGLLDLLELLVVAPELQEVLLLEVLAGHEVLAHRVVLHLGHELLPVVGALLELLALLGESLVRLGAREDGLQVDPVLLVHHPFI